MPSLGLLAVPLARVAAERAEIVSIAEELGVTRLEANSLRSQYRDKLAVFQNRSD